MTLCKYLEWDSRFFGLRIARLHSERVEESVLTEELAWCRENKIDCLYFLADSNDPRSAQVAEQNKFLLTDVRVSLDRPVLTDVCTVSGKTLIRSAKEEDLDALKAIARISHQDSRFYYDSGFDRTSCDRLYETWIERSLKGFAQGVLVAETEGKPVGYLTFNSREGESQIGLFAVDRIHQGKGIGRDLVYRFLGWSREQRVRIASVVTQGRNVPAQRLYQQCGFRTSSFQLWFHRWFVK